MSSRYEHRLRVVVDEKAYPDDQSTVYIAHVCEDCGSLVVDCAFHDRWHDEVNRMSRATQGFFGPIG